MTTNNNLGDLTPEQNTPEQTAEVDPTTEFDVNRKARQDALLRVQDVLSRAARGSKLNQRDFIKAFDAVYQYGAMTDELVTGLMGDLLRVVKAVAQTEVNMFALRTNVKTIARALEKKGIVNYEEMEEIHNKEIVPEEMKRMGVKTDDTIIKKEDIEALQETTQDDG